ncbi:MAG: segregation/condensation protein A [Actinobacteria bacterium]|nr:MAG: segregation/condensation protein A [Actinomycetota bacterium]
MAYKVRVEGFEGPFDLLLGLISRRKVDVYDINVCTIADEYVGYLERMSDLDLDVASEFLLVAATLLELKAAGLFPSEEEVLPEDGPTPAETREILVARLIEYKKFKNAALELAARFESVSKLHPREAGLEPRFAQLLPDFLDGVSLDTLAGMLAEMLAVSEVSILDATHIAELPISIDERIKELGGLIGTRRSLTFSGLLSRSKGDVSFLVATFLALLELYKRGEIELQQQETFGEIQIWPRDRKVS